MPELHFKGKEYVYNHHLTVPYRPLVAHPDRSIGDESENLIIHGDNLHALKALLPRYASKVDCIFIDPPYNTGNENWSYNDNVNSPIMREWLDSNPVDREDTLRHDKWMCMMWPRLQLLWELLADDGVLFVICDENEASNLGVMLREICGEEKYVSTIVWQKVFAKKNKAVISGSHDSLYVYSKKGLLWERNLFDRTEEQEAGFSNLDNDPRGPWQSVSYSVQSESAEKRQKYRYKVELPSGRKVGPPDGRHWNGLRLRYEQLKSENRFWFGQDGDSRPRIKVFLSEVQPGIVPDTWWRHEEFGNNQEAKKELNEIFGVGDAFSTPKPTRLLGKILEIATGKDSLVLDSFAGSGTTAHAVLAQNAKDGGNRRFILVECEDYADKLTAERVRRVIKGYKYHGTQKEEFLREKITWSKFSKDSQHQKILDQVQSIENLETVRFDTINKTIKDGELIVTGEKKVTKKTEGLGGGFTYYTLGDPLDLDKMLSGKSLPDYTSIGAWLFHTATGEPLDPKAVKVEQWYLGASAAFHVWLVYKPELNFLKSRRRPVENLPVGMLTVIQCLVGLGIDGFIGDNP